MAGQDLHVFRHCGAQLFQAFPQCVPTAAGQVRTAHVPREQRVAAEQQTAAQQADGPGAVAGRIFLGAKP